MESPMILYGELTKLEPQDDGTVRVHGVASTGARDSAGESVCPEAMRKALPDYMAFGAIREMHQPLAAGAAISAEVDEDGATRIVARIVDPVAVRKVAAGVYKGFSIGGKVLGRDPLDRTRITAIRLDEISLVDRPCNPEAVIDLWKAAAPPSATPTNAEVLSEAEVMAKAAGRPGRRNDYVATAREALARRIADRTRPAPPPPMPRFVAPPEPPAALAPAPADHHLAKLLAAETALAASQAEIERLSKRAAEADELARRLEAQSAEIETLKRAPLPPRTAASPLLKVIDKTEDGGSRPLSPKAFAEALDALPAAERAHVIMKAALSRPIAL